MGRYETVPWLGIPRWEGLISRMLKQSLLGIHANAGITFYLDAFQKPLVRLNSVLRHRSIISRPAEISSQRLGGHRWEA